MAPAHEVMSVATWQDRELRNFTNHLLKLDSALRTMALGLLLALAASAKAGPVDQLDRDLQAQPGRNLTTGGAPR